MLILEGRDAAGKGGAVKSISEPLNPAAAGLSPWAPLPTARRRSGTFSVTSPISRPPARLVLFDRSWYNRAGVEHVMGFWTDEEYVEFLRACPEFERMLVRSGITC